MSILKVGLVASIPALCGFAGGVLEGLLDYLISRGLSPTLARKLPIVLGMLLFPPSSYVTTPTTPRWWSC